MYVVRRAVASRPSEGSKIVCWDVAGEHRLQIMRKNRKAAGGDRRAVAGVRDGRLPTSSLFFTTR